mmetsp:Transcript_62421/g.172981  ORF Transcript_62421/g.172981 Transcript_62421/m.172981 type:complete len:152 (-) Transcript_62421:244-699(-)
MQRAAAREEEQAVAPAGAQAAAPAAQPAARAGSTALPPAFAVRAGLSEEEFRQLVLQVPTPMRNLWGPGHNAAPGAEELRQRLLQVPTPLRSRWGPGHGAAQRRRLEVAAEPPRRAAAPLGPEVVHNIFGFLQERVGQAVMMRLVEAAPAA